MLNLQCTKIRLRQTAQLLSINRFMGTPSALPFQTVSEHFTLYLPAFYKDNNLLIFSNCVNHQKTYRGKITEIFFYPPKPFIFEPRKNIHDKQQRYIPVCVANNTRIMKSNRYRKATLMLEDGNRFTGYSFGYEASVAGEIVFNTAMTGYPESLTDPSYAGQILVLTYPSIGNYGVPKKTFDHDMLLHFESDRVHVSALIISDYSEKHSHWNATQSLGQWLKEEKVPALFGIDTRRLTKHLRDKGTMLAKIIFDNEEIAWKDPNSENLVARVCTSKKQVYGNGKHKIMLVDCGVKNNIIRYLLRYDTRIIRVPWDYDYSGEEYDGLFISNGPGDPQVCIPTIRHLKTSLQDDKPVFGICLGHQLVALAAGAQTYKLKFGHRSHNQPVIETGTRKAYLTSQNHGFAVDDRSIPEEWEIYFSNLNDGSNEGLRHKSKPVFTTQFHPEAAGGPTDTAFLFEKFVNEIENRKNGKKH